MSPQVIDLLAALFFMFALLLVFRFKKQIGREGSTAYNQIIAGLAIFTLASIVRIYDDAGLFRSVPFLSEPVFCQLVTWIAVITGVALVLSGVFFWLPISREYRAYNKTRVRRLELLKKVEQLVGVEGRIDTVLTTTLDYMLELYGFSRGAVIKYSARQRKITLTSASPCLGIGPYNAHRLAFSDQGWQRYLDGAPAQSAGIITGINQAAGHPQIVLPIQLKRRPIGFFLLWKTRNTVCDHDDELNLMIAADIIARKVELDRGQLRKSEMDRQHRCRLELENALDQTHDLKNEFAAFVKISCKLIQTDFLSLFLIDHQRNQIQRVSSAGNGAVLIEHGLGNFNAYTLVEKALNSDVPLVLDDLSRIQDTTLDDFIPVHGLRSLITLSHRSQNTSAVLIGGSKRSHTFGTMEKRHLSQFKPILARLAASEQTRQARSALKRRLSRLAGLTTHIAAIQSFESTCKYAARLLAEELRTTAVRISLLDLQGAFLESRALETSGSTDGMIPANGTMVLSLMPRHEEVIRSGQTIQIGLGEESGSLSEMEIRQMATPPVHSACLVPIAADERVLGIISIVGGNGTSRSLSESGDILFVNFVAELLVISLRLARRALHPKQPAVGLIVKEPRESMSTPLNSRLKSSLTGILGSLEMLKSHPDADENHVNRYLSIIDRSAHKIDQYIREDESTTPA